jgi:N-acetylglucosamine-6-phosphate deacetylase
MNKILLKNAKISVSKSEQTPISILIEDNHIKDVFTNEESLNLVSDEVFDLDGETILAGFIDIHNHGAVGIDVNSATAEDLRKVSKFLASQGVTAWLPTLVPDTDENYGKVIEAIDELMETQTDEPTAQILGVHYEGVFANEKMCGALRPQFFKTFKNGHEIQALPRLKKGIHLTTLAPEVENGIELIKELKKQDWIVSIGHTRADLPTLDRAFEAGAKHLTHFFNAMTGLHHRDVGVVGWALTREETTFDIIADGVHVNPKMLKFGVQHKGADKVSLISDSVAPTGLGDGEFELWNEKISVVNGKTQNERGSIAGSVITMLDAVKKMLELGFTENEVSKMTSANPAKLLGVEETRGAIEIRKRADLVVLDEQGAVKLVLIAGKILEI